MIITISEKSGLFTKQQTSELNSAFQNINRKIDNYKSEEKDYKEPIRRLGSRSFVAGNILHLREIFQATQVYNRFVKILELPVSVPYDVWQTIYQQNGLPLTIHILDRNVYVFGNAAVGATVAIVTDVVIPYAL